MARQSVEARRATHLRYYYNHKEKHQIWSKAFRTRLKDECFSHYGGYKCVCCGEEQKIFLTIDHVNNDGNVHRKQIGYRGGIGVYTWLRKNNFPEGFQVLCFNCNHGKHLNGGTCPHKEQQCPVSAIKQ